MEFKINETINGGVISLYIDDIKQGYIAYSFEKDDVMNVNTTYVNPELRGQGLASKLFDELIRHARENNYKIVPVCSYIVSKFERNKELQDLLERS